jgi:hypothetical protein
MMSDHPYYVTRSDRIVVNEGWRRDCACRMNPCDVQSHYARTARLAAEWERSYRWTPGMPYIEPPRTVKP